MIFKNKKIILTLVHDFIILCSSFFIALWLRLEEQSFVLLEFLWPYIFMFSLITIALLNRFGLYHGIWKYASVEEISSILKSLLASSLMILAGLFFSIRLENIPRSLPVLLFIVSFLGVASPRFIYRILKDKISGDRNTAHTKQIPVLVVGEGDTAELFIRAANREKTSPFKVIGIIGMKRKSVGRRIHNVSIIMSVENIQNLKSILNKKKLLPQRIIIAEHSINTETLESLFVFSKKNGFAVGELPKITDFKDSNLTSFNTKPIVFEDVLGRSQRTHNTTRLNELNNKVIIVTGAGGSIGSELCNQISLFNPKKLIIFEQNEFNLYQISEKLKGKNIVPVLGDIKDIYKFECLIRNEKPDIIFHAAALKHITFVESDPLEALKNNFLSTVNISKVCIKFKVPKMIFISTDKAVNPSNIMGATKRLCEKYIQMISKNASTNFKILRFGNVLGSTGSVIPLFEKQIHNGGPITITHPNITRYFMTIREAVELVLISSVEKSIVNGSINILEMGKPVKIKDLAERMIKLSGKELNKDIKISYTKLRKGEKLHEDLFYQEETIKKTDNEGILETNSILNPLKKFDIEELIKCINNNDEGLCLHFLQKNLPEYSKV